MAYLPRNLVAAAVAAVSWSTAGRAADPSPVPVPAHLPRYDLAVRLDTHRHVADFAVRVTWTNPSDRPTDTLAFNFYPHYEVPEKDRLLLSKTLELLRLTPSFGLDATGKHGTVDVVKLVRMGNDPAGEPRPLPYKYREDLPTAITVELPRKVGPGEAVTVELAGKVELRNKQGRWGHWQGVTYLTNALPVVAFYDADGWHETPFVPWHQPFYNEAGVYHAAVELPRGQVLACSAAPDSQADLGNGWVRHQMKPFVGRDFALTASADYQEHKSSVPMPDGRAVVLRVVALPGHDFYAKEILRIVADALPVYSKWFGPFPYDQFTVAESFFGWNGNELSGMILIDERVFGMPHTAVGYAEYLVSHEVCHQWWYNQVGTNGYAETFMDEGAATFFTHKLMDHKFGKNNQFLAWPDGLKWLPNIQRENYRYASVYGAIGRADMKPAAGELPKYGHLIGLFTGAYDRGSKALELVEARLGEAAFLDFTRGVVKKYSFRVLTAKQYQQELEAYTGRPWGDFFQNWIYGKELPDWTLTEVRTAGRAGPLAAAAKGGRRVEVVVKQTGGLDEPTVVGFQFAEGDGFPVRIPVSTTAQTVRFADYEAEVEPIGERTAVVRVTLPREPVQVAVDPDRTLLDANPADNRWKNPPKVYATPVYSMLNETDLTNDYDRWNVGVGPWVGGALYPDPWYTRSTTLGVRAGAYRTQQFSGGAYLGYRTDYRDIILGADGLIDHFPGPRTQVGFNVEQRVAGPYGGTDGENTATRGVLFGRYVLEYGSSLYLPPISYVDLFTTYSDNFLPFARESNPGAVRPDYTWLTGLHYRLNLYTPYWDPETGFWVDLTYGLGVASVGSRDTTHQLKGELAGVTELPTDHPYWSDVKLAGRVVVWGATPDNAQFFALGGGTLFRGFDLAQRQGSLLWVANAEVRLPVAREVRWDVLDHFIGGRNLYLAGFYDVGAVYTDGRSVGGVAHALGAGLRADIAVFSFIERAVLRFDVAKTVNAATGMQFWFGVQHPF